MGLEINDFFAGKYKITEQIGQDEFGTRFIAEDTESGRLVQLKTLASQMQGGEEAKSRFKREIQLLSSLNHPGIVKVVEAGEHEGVFYLVCEHDDGITLSEYLESQEKLNEKDAVHLIIPVIESLQHGWEEKNIVHRDLKPEKIFITDSNKIKLLDLGLAKSMSSDNMNLTGAGIALGTPEYMSPEQAAGDELDFHSDMYSLGLILYRMVTGNKPFTGSIMEVINKQLNEMPPPASESGVSERCSKIINQMIEKSTKDRFESWKECLDAMHLLLDTTVLESDLQFDLGDLDNGDDFEPSVENLTVDDDGAFGSPSVNASGIILEEDDAPSISEQAAALTGGIDVIEPGTVVGNGYEIDRQIGSGSMGDIYLAFSEELDKLVQVKILPSHMTNDHEKVERFLQEIEFTASLQHPNLLSVIEAGEDSGRYYLATQYEEGVSFHDYIGRYGPLSEQDALSFMIQIADVLRYAWQEKKLLHREIKPENMLIVEGTKEAKLTDFGVAKSLEGEALNLTGMGFTIGTPDYMSPEQVRGDENLDIRSDMYAIGLVLYEAMTQRKAFVSSNIMELMNMQLSQAHEPVNTVNSDISKNCSELIDRLLSKDREQRFADWDDMLAGMKAVLEGGSVPPIGSGSNKDSAASESTGDGLASPEAVSPMPESHAPAAPVSPPKKKGPMIITAVAVVVIIIIIYAIW